MWICKLWGLWVLDVVKITRDEYIRLLKVSGKDLTDIDTSQYSDMYFGLSTTTDIKAVCGLHYQKNNITQVNGLASFDKGYGSKLLNKVKEYYDVVRLNCTGILYDKVYSKLGFRKYLELGNYVECIYVKQV